MTSQKHPMDQINRRGWKYMYVYHPNLSKYPQLTHFLNCFGYFLVKMSFVAILSNSFLDQQGNQRWQTSPAAPPGGLGHSPTFWHQSRISTTIRSRDMAKSTFLTFRRPTTLTFDLKFWKYLSVTVYPYVICMPSFIMIGWEMAEILHFEILRKHGQTNTQTHTQTNKHTHKQTWALQYLALPLWGARSITW